MIRLRLLTVSLWRILVLFMICVLARDIQILIEDEEIDFFDVPTCSTGCDI